MSDPQAGRATGGEIADAKAPASPRGVPRASPLFLVAVGMVIVLVGLLALRQAGNADTGFHLEAGNFILDGHGWPAKDPFTYTLGERDYVDTSWGFQVALALVERAFGAPGMVLLAVALVVTLFALLVLTARLVPGDSHVLPLLLLAGGLAAEPRFEVRPEIVSYTLLGLVLYLLHRHAEGLASPLWLLPPVFAVWINAHGGLFVLGFGAAGCFLAGLALRHGKLDWRLAGWTGGALLATLLNPYGWKALVFPLTLATRMRADNPFRATIGEFGSLWAYTRSDQLTFYLVPIACTFLVVALVLLSLRGLLRGKRYWCLLLCLVFLPLALTMVRNVPSMVVACLPWAAWGLSLDRVMNLLRVRGPVPRALGRTVLIAVAAVTLLTTIRVCTDAYYVAGRRTERFGVGWNRLSLPVDAVAHADRVGIDGPVLNHINFGGYLMWARSDPVFIDGRLEVAGERFYRTYRDCLGSPQGFGACVSRYGIRWVVFPYRSEPALLAGLSRRPSWRLVYFDHIATIFVDRRHPTDSLMDDGALELERQPRNGVSVESLPGLGDHARPGRAERWLAGLVWRRTYPVEAFNRGVFHFYRADPANAARSFAAAIEQSGGAYYEIYSNLGEALFTMGRLGDARRCYEIALDEVPFYRAAQRRRLERRIAEIEASVFP